MLVINHLPPKNPSVKDQTVDVNKRWSQVHGKFPPIIRKTYLPDAKKYRDMNTKVDYEAQKEHEIVKREQQKNTKIELEQRGCLFTPELNKHSLKLVTAQNRVKVQDQDLPNRYNRAYLENQETMRFQTLEADDLATLKIPEYQGRQYNPEFYQDKMAWKAQVNQKMDTRRNEEFDKLTQTLVGKPTLNDYSNHKIVRSDSLDKAPFLERVKKNIDKKQELMKTLTDKYYDHPFKPTSFHPEKNQTAKI